VSAGDNAGEYVCEWIDPFRREFLMPTYEYACAACGHKFEEFQSIKAAPVKKCPMCGKNKVQRLISAGAGFIFKGSGFYETDYRSDKYKADARADMAPAAKTATSTTTSTPGGGATSTTAAASAPAPAVADAAPSKGTGGKGKARKVPSGK
jgi:putative FmdB family regulatory protein